MKNIYLFFLSLLTFTLMSFTMNSVKYINKSKAHGVQRLGQKPDCNKASFFRPCNNSMVSWEDFQGQQRTKTQGELEFHMWLNNTGKVIFEFDKNAVSDYFLPQKSNLKYYHLTEDLEISDPNLLQDMGYHQPTLTLQKGSYELQVGLFKYTVTIPLKTNQLGH